MNRKSLLALIILFGLCIPNLSSAQLYRDSDNTEPGRRLQRVGVRAGTAISWISAPNIPNKVPQVGVQGGIYYRLQLSKKIHYNPELSASFKGSKFNPDIDTGYYFTRLGLFYIESPQYLMFTFDKAEKHNLMIGPVVSYLARPTLFIKNEAYPTFTDLPLKRWEFSVNVAYMFNTEYVGIQVAYKHGLTNIAKNFSNYGTPGNNGSQGTLYLNEVNPSLSNVKAIYNRGIEITLYF